VPDPRAGSSLGCVGAALPPRCLGQAGRSGRSEAARRGRRPPMVASGRCRSLGGLGRRSSPQVAPRSPPAPAVTTVTTAFLVVLTHRPAPALRTVRGFACGSPRLTKGANKYASSDANC
jgi:hypothetical protein